MKKKYRIKKYSEIDAIFKEKKTKSNSFFSIYHSSNEDKEHFRFALSIGKKFGKAVQRNKIKRQLRMIIHEHRNEFKNESQFVVVIKPKANTLLYHDIKHHLIDLLKKTKLLENNNE